MLKNKVSINRLVIVNTKFSLTPINKVIKFKTKNTGILSDDDIKCLFVGLYNIIKSNVQKQTDEYYRNQLLRYKNMADISATKVVKLERSIKELKDKINIKQSK